MKKIEKVADTLSTASIEKKPKMLAQIEAKLGTAAKQSFGDGGDKYVELIMQGVRLSAFNDTFNVPKEIDTSQFKAKNDIISESTVDAYQSSERIVKDHLAKQITDKIEAFSKMYMMKLKTSDEKRNFLENVRKKFLDMVKTKHFEALNDNDIVNYNEMITKSMNVILKRNLEQSARRMVFSQERQTQNSSGEWLEYRKDKNHENDELEKECVVSIAKTCAEVKLLNKFSCQTGEKNINVEDVFDRVVNCSESDVINSTHQANKILHDAKNTLFEMKQLFEQNCLSDKINETRTYRNIINDLIKAQINVVSDFQDSLDPNKKIANNEETLKKVLDILNAIVIYLSKGICSRQEKASELVANARRFNQILDEDLEQVIIESALFPKSCVCDKDRCISHNCIKSCTNFCILHYSLGRWSCSAVIGNSSIHLNAICDGKLDCYDESDESECSTGKGRNKFKANEAFLQTIKIFEMKMASKDYDRVTQMLLVAEKRERPTPLIFKQIVRDVLQDLVYAYASLDISRRKNTHNDVQEFFDVAQIVVNALKTCGKYFSLIFLSFPVSFTSAMFRWLEDDTFDCVVGIAVDNKPVGVGTFVHDRLVITSANPLANVQKHRIKLFAINGNPESAREVNVDYITVDKERQREWIRVGFDKRHNTNRDITLISVTDNETVFIKHQTLPRRPYYLPLANKEAEAAIAGWQFAGFGYASRRHVKNSSILKAVTYRHPVLVDCKKYLPIAWGHFICILNVENFAGIQSGAPLIHKNSVYGVGSFSFVKDNSSILVFTDTRDEDNMAGTYRWVPACLSQRSIPPGALRVGTDVDGDEIYAGRAHHEGDILPAKVIPSKNACYIAYGGEEILKDQFEVLVPAIFSWQFSTNGAVPPGAVEAGVTADGEKLYFGRVTHDGCTTPGKIHPSHGACYYPFDGEEKSSAEYECLVLM
ncbi:unnamed protein product [Parnassius apollo]|uniref:(apollo) hypothetical protein n=1 Tax=Parnassius apollo TaxID=110799 RepID=A0A8S3WMY2_PARAO|nr:unnamed protein product [Parnassius apollo]